MKQPRLIDLQKEHLVDKGILKDFLRQIVGSVPEADDRGFTVALVPDDRMRQLNHLFRGKDITTDVLSFPHEPDEFDPDKANLGDIVISAGQAQKQAAENGLSLEGEIKQLILHGVLHLCGYDHETDNGEMNERELELRERLQL